MGLSDTNYFDRISGQKTYSQEELEQIIQQKKAKFLEDMVGRNAFGAEDLSRQQYEAQQILPQFESQLRNLAAQGVDLSVIEGGLQQGVGGGEDWQPAGITLTAQIPGGRSLILTDNGNGQWQARDWQESSAWENMRGPMATAAFLGGGAYGMSQIPAGAGIAAGGGTTGGATGLGALAPEMAGTTAAAGGGLLPEMAGTVGAGTVGATTAGATSGLLPEMAGTTSGILPEMAGSAQQAPSWLSNLGEGGSKLWEFAKNNPMLLGTLGQIGSSYMGAQQFGNAPDWKDMGTPTDWYNDPYVQGMLGQTERQVGAAARARGMDMSGRTLQEIADATYSKNLLPMMQTQAAQNQAQNQFNYNNWMTKATGKAGMWGDIGQGGMNLAQMAYLQPLVDKAKGG